MTLDEMIEFEAEKFCVERGVYDRAAREAVAREIRQRIVAHFSYDRWVPAVTSNALSDILLPYKK
jgi:hypothetical protein